MGQKDGEKDGENEETVARTSPQRYRFSSKNGNGPGSEQFHRIQSGRGHFPTRIRNLALIHPCEVADAL
jgi:hypothetical protein